MALFQVRIWTPAPLKNGSLFMKDAQCGETNDLQFLFFELWSILYSTVVNNALGRIVKIWKRFLRT